MEISGWYCFACKMFQHDTWCVPMRCIFCKSDNIRGFMPEEIERLSPDDTLYLKETLEEVSSLQTSANTLLNFCRARLAKKYSLIDGCGMNPETGIITRPKPQKVEDEKAKEDSN